MDKQMSMRLVVRLSVAAAVLGTTDDALAAFHVPISSYDDDPFVEEARVERMTRWRFGYGEDGSPTLFNGSVGIEDETVVYRADPDTGEYIAFAWNPWLPELTTSNAEGNFVFPDEERFPLHRVERGSDGKVVLHEGLQLWLPQDLHLGMTTLFEATNSARQAAEVWSGRELPWGDAGYLYVNAHAFIDFNAFYSPSARGLFFGVVPHRLPGEASDAPVKMFETATSWDIVAHESGHALHDVLKPNVDLSDAGYRTWSESFGDQLMMWGGLRDGARRRALIAKTGGDLYQSNPLTRVGEALAVLIGEGTGLRDCFHDKTVSGTSEEFHDRSEVLTGGLYDVFVTVYEDRKTKNGASVALRKAGRIMGRFLTRAADYTPESRLTLEDVAKAYLKVDKELYDGRYHATLVDEFIEREIFDTASLAEWLEHEASVPNLWLSSWASDYEAWELLDANLYELGIGPEFGLWLQSITRLNPYKPSAGQTIVRVQLTLGRGAEAVPLANHGILVFRGDGSLADYHSPIPPAEGAERLPDVSTQVQALLSEAEELSRARPSAPLSMVRGANGQLSMEAHVLRGKGLNTYMEVFTAGSPHGERREIVMPPVPPDKRVPIPDDVLN